MPAQMSNAKDQGTNGEVRAVMPAGLNPTETLDLIKRFPEVKIIAFLLVPDPDHPAAQSIKDKNHWAELDHLTSKEIMVVVFQSPTTWPDGVKERWKVSLPHQTWEEWQKEPDAGKAYEYLDLVHPPLRPSQLPCVAFVTDLHALNCVVRPLPDWDVESEYKLLANIFGAARECTSIADPAARLECLKQTLSSPGKLIQSGLDHIKDRAVDFVKKHPAEMLSTGIGFIIALGSATVAGPWGIAVAFLTTLKGEIDKKSS